LRTFLQRGWNWSYWLWISILSTLLITGAYFARYVTYVERDDLDLVSDRRHPSLASIRVDTVDESGSKFASVAINHGTSDSFTDSFEAGGTAGWSSTWGDYPLSGSYESGLQTTTEITPPPGGGSYTLRQWWHHDLAVYNYPDWLIYDFTPDLGEHDVFELQYYLYYDPNFDSGPEDRVKTIIMQSDSQTDDRIYINSHGGGGASVFLQLMPNYEDKHRFANINGGNYVHPNGQWVHYRWEIKLSALNGPTPNTGYIKGWVNGTQRWQYQNISTHDEGSIDYFNMNTTINQSSPGNNQKRYWDMFSIKTIERDADGESR
jgi:hypothetical protein